MKQLHGVGVALVTPFKKNNDIDFDALERLLNHTAQGGVGYWVVHGTTGESVTTTSVEKKEILTFIKAHNPNNIPIIYGLGGPNTADICRQMDTIAWEGITAILSVTPYYNRPSQAGLYTHYQTIAAAAPVPIILYNVPARTGTNLAPDTVIRLSKLANVKGIKEASGHVLPSLEIAQGISTDFLLIAGDDLLTLPLMAIGAVGVISTLANILPKQMTTLAQACTNQDYTTARQILYKLLPICQFIAHHGNPVATKQLLAIHNICERHVRIPLATVDTTGVEEARKCLAPSFP
jgi:4-hydroxy-tetrahydrodipicolinate synthase